MTRKNHDHTIHGNDRADTGLYGDLRHLRLHRLDEPGRLPGGPEDTWRRIPEVLQLVLAPLVGLAYLMFLPFVGFVLLAGVIFDALGRRLRPVAVALGRIARPVWQPALAFLGRRRRRRAKGSEERPKDEWAEQVRDEIDSEK